MALPRLWNWQQQEWPTFRYEAVALRPAEADFLRRAGHFLGTIRHVSAGDREQLTIEIISDEALHTSEIEGERLNRDSLQSSLRRHFGFTHDARRVAPAEEGVARLMTALFRDFREPLTEERLCQWHRLLLQGRTDLRDLGRYRTDPTPMQVISGPVHEPRVHFEAPPAAAVPREMQRFLTWYAHSQGHRQEPLPLLIRAGLAHLYFVSIHPFEDGNGRLARAVSEKVISEGLGEPTLLALSQTINAQRKRYYELLERSNRELEVTEWLLYFAHTVLEAQASAQRLVEFILAKSRLLERLRGQLNERQEKALLRVLREGPEGFKGGLSAENYVRITGASRATATRDLADLVAKGALGKTGVLKGTRYYLLLPA